MFTGIVERTAELVALEDTGGGRRLEIEVAPLEGLPEWCPVELGESIAIDGVCLTAVAFTNRPGGGRVTFEAVPETLRVSTLARLARGDRVNVERSLRVGDSLGGHWVTGHVDTLGEVIERRVEGDQTLFRIGLPRDRGIELLPKGSVAVDGVSLTVIDVVREASTWFSFAAIPHTLERTTLGERQPGAPVNLELDALGKWVLHGLAQLFGEGGPPSSWGGPSLDRQSGDRPSPDPWAPGGERA